MTLKPARDLAVIQLFAERDAPRRLIGMTLDDLGLEQDGDEP